MKFNTHKLNDKGKRIKIEVKDLATILHKAISPNEETQSRFMTMHKNKCFQVL